MNTSAQKIALVLIDVQKGFQSEYWGRRYSPDAELHIAQILKTFRDLRRPIFHVQHLSLEPQSPLRAGQAGVDFMDFAVPNLGEYIIKKNVNSAFIGTRLEERLRSEGIQSIVIVGISVDHCVSTSTRMAANLGFKVTLVSDATIAFDRVGADGKVFSAELVHAVSLASLHGEFAQVVKTAQLLQQI